MLKSYFSVRVYVIIDACLLAVWLVSGINGWAVFTKYPYIAAGVWCILTIPLAGIGLLSVYQRVQLHHRKNVHTQYEYEQQTELRLEQMRQHYALPSPNDGTATNLLSTVHQPVEPSVQLSSPVVQSKMSTQHDMMSTKMSSDVQLETDEIDVVILAPMEQSIYDNEKRKAQKLPCKTDEQLGQRWGVSSKTIQRTRDKMRDANKL